MICLPLVCDGMATNTQPSTLVSWVGGAGLQKFQIPSEVYLRYPIIWLYKEYGAIILAVCSSPYMSLQTPMPRAGAGSSGGNRAAAALSIFDLRICGGFQQLAVPFRGSG